MQAAVFDGQLRVAHDHPVPVPQLGEALIRVSLAGVCGTDLEILQGYADFHGVPGHEFVGVVTECSDEWWTGKRVVGEINIACGECRRCGKGLHKHCAQRRVLGIRGKDGAFAQYLTLPVENLHVVPDHVSDEEAVFTEPLAAAFDILEKVKVRTTDCVLVLGDGRLGMLVAQVLSLRECDVRLVGKHPSKLARAQRLGLVTDLACDVEGEEADIVVDCTGSAQGFMQVLALVRPQGTVVVKSTFHGELPSLTSQVVVDEIKIVGSRCGPFAPALRALSEGGVTVTPFIEATYPLSEIDQAVEHTRQRQAFKVLVKP